MTLQSSRLAFIRGRHPRIHPGSCVRGLLGVKRVVEPPEGRWGQGCPRGPQCVQPPSCPVNCSLLVRLGLSHPPGRAVAFPFLFWVDRLVCPPPSPGARACVHSTLASQGAHHPLKPRTVL